MCCFGNGHRNIVSPLSEHQSFSFHNTGFLNLCLISRIMSHRVAEKYYSTNVLLYFLQV